MKVKRNERRHQRLRTRIKRIHSRQREWYYLESSGQQRKTTPVCLDEGFLTYPVEPSTQDGKLNDGT